MSHFPKSIFVFGVITFAVFQNSLATEVEQDVTHDAGSAIFSPKVDHQDVGCGIYRLNSALSFKIKSPYFQNVYNSSSHECTWEFYGTEECNPAITCDNFDLLESPSCDTEFLALHDASGGEAKFCGTIAPNLASSSSILIAYFKTEEQNRNKGFHCNVACAPLGSETSFDSFSLTRKSNGKNIEVCKAANRIVGGVNTTIEEFPYQVSLQADGAHNCGGSIISSNRILTAAHCTDEYSASSLSVRIKSSQRESGGEVIKVQSICQHPGYDDETVDNDISVLRLASTITFDAKAKSICIPPIGSGLKIPAGTLGTATGWGLLSEGGILSKQLQKVDVPKVSQQDCRNSYGEEDITDNMICFGLKEGGKGVCQGDSGGPIVIKNTQVGVVSFGAECAEADMPGVYVDLSVASIQNHIMSCK